MITLKEYFDTNVQRKDGVWASRIVSYMRTYWKPLVDAKVYSDNMDIIMSKDNMKEVASMFKDPTKLGFEFLPITIIEKVRNILIAERTKAGISVNIKAADPTSQVERDNDATLLKGRKEIESLMSYLNSGIGLPPYQLAQEIQKDGTRPFSGNIEMFDQLGLDDTSEYEIAYFFNVWHKLMHEIDCQQVVSTVFAANEVNNFIEYWCNDILAVKAIAWRGFVNQNSGAIELKRISPTQVMHIPGQRDDGKDAITVGYEDSMSVVDFVRLMGAEIDIEEEMQYLINAVNYIHHTDIVSVLWDRKDSTYRSGNGTMCAVDEFMQYKLNVGYIEWKSIDAKPEKAGTDWHGNSRIYPLLDENTDVNDSSSYVKRNFYEQNTYKCFYLPVATTDQRIYKFGRVYHQVIEGAEDEYSSFTISYKVLPGPTVAEVARPFIKIAQETFAKFKWFIRRAKPKGRSFNYQSLMDIARKMFAQTNQPPDIQRVIDLYDQGINEVFIPAKSPTGGTMGGGSNPNYEVPNGLDPTAIHFKDIIGWAVEMIMDAVGVEPRAAYSPKQNEGYKIKEAATEQSRNATEYMTTMLDSLASSGAKYVVTVAQDILKFKSSLPYKWLLYQLGNPTLNRLSLLGNVALHRYGIFVNSYRTYMDREIARQNTQVAFQRGEIPFEVMMLLNEIPDAGKTNYILAFEKKRAEQQKIKEEQQLSAIRQAEDAKKTQNLIAVEDKRGKSWTDRENVRGYWLWMIAQAGNQNKADVSKMKLDAKPDEIALKASAHIRQELAKKSAENQEALPPDMV